MNKKEFEKSLKLYAGKEVYIIDDDNDYVKVKLFHTIRKSKYGYLILEFLNYKKNNWEWQWEEVWIEPEEVLVMGLLENYKKEVLNENGRE